MHVIILYPGVIFSNDWFVMSMLLTFAVTLATANLSVIMATSERPAVLGLARATNSHFQFYLAHILLCCLAIIFILRSYESYLPPQ